MVRELTSFFVAVLSLLYIWQTFLLATSPSGFASYLLLLQNPAMITFSIIALGFVLYHSLTWFFLIGRLYPLKIGGKTASPFVALVADLVLMAAISYAVVKILLGV